MFNNFFFQIVPFMK